jgi:hypothetical protein
MEMALKVGLIVSFSNLQDQKGMWKTSREVNGVKVYIRNDEISYSVLETCCTSFIL